MVMTLAECQKRYQHLVDKQNLKEFQHIKFNENETVINDVVKNKIYVPSVTGRAFHGDDSFVRTVIGPYGSGKSTMAIQEIVKRASEMPFWFNGRRRSKWCVVRNTSGELYSTTLQTWLAWFEGLGDITKRQKPILTYEHFFSDDKGIVELEVIFLALDREDDVRKVKSLELTGAFLNELSEIPQAALAHMKGRVNRYPSKAFCEEPYWSGIICDSNPCSTDDWMYKEFVEKQTEGYKLFRQPPGLIKIDDKWKGNPDADNATHLPNDYYEKLALGNSQEFINVFCLGSWGVVGFGKKVYPEFNSDLHSVDSIEALQGEPLYIGVDFGLTPAFVVCQIAARGQLLVLKEYCGENIGIRNFAEMVVIPSLKKDFPYCPKWICYADPAGRNRSDIIEEMSAIGELNSIGMSTIAARTNDIPSRLGSVRFFLNKMVDGKPAFLLDKKKCPVLYRGFTKDFVFDRIAVAGEERYRDKPTKNMSSHPQDALGYNCLELASDTIAQEKTTGAVVDMYNPCPRIMC